MKYTNNKNNISKILQVYIINSKFSGNSRIELTNSDGKACNNIPEAVNQLALSACLDHSSSTG
jgi:hypothetical protein